MLDQRRLPLARRFRGVIIGASFGGLAATVVVPAMGPVLHELSGWLATVLIKLGLPKAVSVWSDVYFTAGVLSVGAVVGAWLGWWLTREKVK